MRRMRRGDRGSATVWSLGLMAVLLAVFMAVLAMEQAVIARHRAGAAADLAALAAADHALDGRNAACALASRVARLQGAVLARCAIEGEVSDVVATVGAARVRSRAGPPESAPSPGAPGPSPPAGPPAPPAPPVPAGWPGGPAVGLSTAGPMGAVRAPIPDSEPDHDPRA